MQSWSQWKTWLTANLVQLKFCCVDFNHSSAKWFYSYPNTLQHCPGDGVGSRRWGTTDISGWGHTWTLHPWVNTLTTRSICNGYHLLLKSCLQRQMASCIWRAHWTPKMKFVFLLLLVTSSFHHFFATTYFQSGLYNQSCYSSPQGQGLRSAKKAVPWKYIGW